jgi:hypothetical protein
MEVAVLQVNRWLTSTESGEWYITRMERFLIEVPHEAGQEACLAALRILLSSGSHFLTHTDFGCMDDVHKAWLIVEVESKEEARCLLPPLYRPSARIVKLTKFSLDQVENMMGRLAAGTDTATQ